MKVHIKNEIL